MASHLSRRGSNFCRFFCLGHRKNNDILGIYFVRNNCVFSDVPEPVQNKFHFFGEFFRMYFSSYFLFPGYVFILCFFGWSTTSGWASEKTPAHFFGAKKKNNVFSRETIRCILAPALSLRKRIPYFSANRLQPRISRNQHIQTYQFKTTNIEIHPAFPKVYTHLIFFGEVKMTNVSENFGNILVWLRPWKIQSTISV